MTPTTSKLGAEMLKDLEEIRRTLKNASCMSDYGDAVEILSDLIDAHARQPAAIDKEAVCRVCNGHGYRTAMSATGEGAFNETCVYCKGTGKAAPLAKEASKPAAPEGWKPELLYGPCQNVCWTQDMVPREERIDAVVISHADYERLLAASPTAPLVEQDERGAFSAIHEFLGIAAKRLYPTPDKPNSDWAKLRTAVDALALLEARAASTSANVAQLDMSLEARLTDAEADVKRLHAEKMELWSQVHGYSANVAQGAEAVAPVKVYETYTGQNGWTEVTQEEYDRTKDKYEHRIRRVPAPPAQTALTEDARDSIIEAMARAMNMATDGHERYWSGYVKSAEAAFDAAQSASGDANG